MEFTRQTVELKKIFVDLVSGFGLNHSRIFVALLADEIKTANQLIEETQINQATTYSVLRDLQKWELINCSNTNPASHYISDALKSFEKQVKKVDITAKRQIKYREEINKLISEFQQIAKTAPEREKQVACSYYK